MVVPKQGVAVHSVVTVSRVLEVLTKHKKITEEMASKVRDFLSNNQTNGQ